MVAVVVVLQEWVVGQMEQMEALAAVDLVGQLISQVALVILRQHRQAKETMVEMASILRLTMGLVAVVVQLTPVQTELQPLAATEVMEQRLLFQGHL